MIRKRINHAFKLVVLLATSALLAGCSSVSYYSQSILGHSKLMLARKSVDDVILNADETLKAKLLLSKELRLFSANELGLPGLNSYKTYVPLEREFPVWTVVAAPEFSLSAKQWCYPVIGCANYRGYFNEHAAKTYAEKLQHRGFETEVGGAPAYSTLGWFSDPLLPSMMTHGDTEFAEMLFHEMAHQKLYINGDSGFNEAFASVVGEVGVRRWLAENRPDKIGAYNKRLKVREQFYSMLNLSKTQLRALYDSGLPESEMRVQKQAILRDLRARYEQVRVNEWNGEEWYKAWFDDLPNNAKLVAISTYRDQVPKLHALLTECGQSLSRFYKVLSSAQTHNQRVVVPHECHEISSP